MNKRSPLQWNASAKIDAFNYKYQPPLSDVKVFDDKSPKRVAASRCAPHTNIHPFPVAPPEPDYSWVRTAPPVAGSLPDEHPLSPKRLREADKERLKAELGDDFESEATRSERKSVATSFSKDNPNSSDFSLQKRRSRVFDDKRSGAFGEVERFTGHKAGGHFSSKTKSLLEITRASEIDLQKQRDVAEAKAKILLSGGSLVGKRGGSASP